MAINRNAFDDALFGPDRNFNKRYGWDFGKLDYQNCEIPTKSWMRDAFFRSAHIVDPTEQSVEALSSMEKGARRDLLEFIDEFDELFSRICAECSKGSEERAVISWLREVFQIIREGHFPWEAISGERSNNAMQSIHWCVREIPALQSLNFLHKTRLALGKWANITFKAKSVVELKGKHDYQI